MARRANYEEKIAQTEAKIAKKQAEIKKLKDQLAEFKAAQENIKNQELSDFMDSNGISRAQAVEILKNALNNQQQ